LGVVLSTIKVSVITEWEQKMPTKKFETGKSGNPKGRPKNQTATTKLRKTIVDAMPEIIQGLIGAAKQGDVGAATVLLNRCVPALKPEAMAISLPVKTTLVEQGAIIVKATMSGSIPPDVGAALISALSNQSRIVEIDELTKRLEVLEAVK
jgi:hypothetical protein